MENLTDNMPKRMNFVVNLTYDDIFDSFSYNIKILLESLQSAINLTIPNYNRIIKKRSSINQIYKETIDKLNLKQINLVEIL